MSAPEGCADPIRYERAEELATYHRPEQVWPAHLECTCGNPLPCSIAQSAARSMISAVTKPPANRQRALAAPGVRAPIIARGIAEVPRALDRLLPEPHIRQVHAAGHRAGQGKP